MKNISQLSLVEVADMIRSRKLSSEEVTRACIERAQALQPKLNCFIALEVDDALAAARSADADLAKGVVRGPLHGVPLAHKDMYYRKGKISTCGSEIRRDWVADSDSTALARLRNAGAIQLGTLNMSQFALNPTGHNVHMGHCRNPWNTAYITGGSSSGSGASVAARIVFGALGSDTGGSIRLPASNCGVSGLRPTTGRISRHGAMPLSFSLDCVGPLARTVADCARLTGVMAGADPLDPTAAHEAVPAYEAELKAPVNGLKIGVPKGYFDHDVHRDVMKVMTECVAEFRSLGCDIVEVVMPELDSISAGFSVLMSAEAASVHAQWLRERPEDYMPQIRARLEMGIAGSAVDYLDALKMRGPALAEFCGSVFTKCDALLAPVASMPVPTIDESDVGDSERMGPVLGELTRFTRPLSYLGLPVLSVPAGFAGNGLPVGVQLVGRPFAEALLFRIGHAYQQATDWHTRAPTII